ncbi:MAG: ABC transporter permease [Candidatus Parvarchaeota archaeon]|nr:ABC transporter permease [Candidatus Haiyanarchaeum thermophilum]
MKAKKLVGLAWKNLKQRKLRTFLTILSISIGITTIVAVASLGEGFRGRVRERMEHGFELDVLLVFPGSFTAGLRDGFSSTDMEYIRNLSGVSLVTPLITIPITETINLTTENGTKLGAFTIGGINFGEMVVMFPNRFTLLSGNLPAEGETSAILLGYKAAFINGSQVAEIGDKIFLTILQPNATPPFLRINFSVAGILTRQGTLGITNFDYWAFISLDEAIELIRNKDKPYQLLIVKVSNVSLAEEVAKQIERHFPPYSVSVFVPTSFARQVDIILTLVEMFLIGIGSISLLVAGIGIMNIMMISVIERTREIGILKAIGAKNSTILLMFLAEALLMGVIGGVLGLFTGYFFSYGLANLLSTFIHRPTISGIRTPEVQEIRIIPNFSPLWMIIAFSFSITISLIFGLYPARKAAKLNPVEALRYE